MPTLSGNVRMRDGIDSIIVEVKLAIKPHLVKPNKHGEIWSTLIIVAFGKFRESIFTSAF